MLRNPDLEIRGSLFLNNLRNKPLYLVNGGKDPLYPIAAVEPSIAFMNDGRRADRLSARSPRRGTTRAGGRHLKDDFETFVRTHPRVPLPDTLTWESRRRAPGTARTG